MFLDTVTYDPSAGFRAQDLNTIRTNKLAKNAKIIKQMLCSSEASVIGKDSLLPPSNIRQHLYKLTPLSPMQTTATVSFYSCQFSIDYIAGIYTFRGEIFSKCYALSRVLHVGKMDIVWRSRFGERGRIQTGQLKATVSPLSPTPTPHLTLSVSSLTYPHPPPNTLCFLSHLPPPPT